MRTEPAVQTKPQRPRRPGAGGTSDGNLGGVAAQLASPGRLSSQPAGGVPGAKPFPELIQLENDSLQVIREARERCPRLACLWSMGKDSTALLWLCRKAFHGQVPFPVVHLDTGYKFPDMYAFRDRLATAWQLDLRVASNSAAPAAGIGPETADRLACCQARKTEALRQVLAEMRLDAVLVGIRRDEHGVRAKERYFSPRAADGAWRVGEQPPELWDLYSVPDDADHLRIHPLLHFGEEDVWRYHQREGIPVNPLYFARDGWRYRSLGCAPCCTPIPSTADSIPAILAELAAATAPERAGRAQDKEDPHAMQKLRSLGYL